MLSWLKDAEGLQQYMLILFLQPFWYILRRMEVFLLNLQPQMEYPFVINPVSLLVV